MCVWEFVSGVMMCVCVCVCSLKHMEATLILGARVKPRASTTQSVR